MDPKYPNIDTFVTSNLGSVVESFFSTLKDWLSTNCKNQQLSTIYPSINYDYDYYHRFTTTIDMTPLQI